MGKMKRTVPFSGGKKKTMALLWEKKEAHPNKRVGLLHPATRRGR